jgi:hypothetical protein
LYNYFLILFEPPKSFLCYEKSKKLEYWKKILLYSIPIAVIGLLILFIELFKSDKVIYDLNYFGDSIKSVSIIENETVKCNHANLNEIKDPKSLLISILLQREANQQTRLSSREDIIWQIRIVYLAFLGIVLSIIFGGKLKRKEKYRIIPVTIIYIIIIFYIDLHYNDVNDRQYIKLSAYNKAIDSLDKYQIPDTICYNINYAKLDTIIIRTNKYACWRELHNAYSKKYNKSFIEQITFYVIPFLIFCWIGIYLYKKGNNKKKN